MNKTLQYSLLAASIIVLLIVLWYIRKNKMNIHYAMVWIIWAVGMIAIAAFPSIGFKIGKMLGIEVVSNAVFLVAIFFLYCLTFYVYLTLSKHNEEIISLNYEIATLKKKVEELEDKGK